MCVRYGVLSPIEVSERERESGEEQNWGARLVEAIIIRLLLSLGGRRDDYYLGRAPRSKYRCARRWYRVPRHNCVSSGGIVNVTAIGPICLVGAKELNESQQQRERGHNGGINARTIHTRQRASAIKKMDMKNKNEIIIKYEMPIIQNVLVLFFCVYILYRYTREGFAAWLCII